MYVHSTMRHNIASSLLDQGYEFQHNYSNGMLMAHVTETRRWHRGWWHGW